MTRTLATWLALWALIASAVLVGSLLATAIAPAPVAASRPAQQAVPSSGDGMTTVGVSPQPSPDFAGRTGQPDSHPGAQPTGPVPGRVTPRAVSPVRLSTSAVTGSGPEPTSTPRSRPSLRGIASFMAPAYGARYLALPAGPGHRVTICGPAACVTRTSNDAGPDLAMQRAGRVADLSFADFRTVCGCDPWVVGLVRVTVED